MANVKYIIPITKKYEGGLSNSKTDKASSYPSPYFYNGVNDWHTNKGVTYKTFEYLSGKLGYENNSENFINMPDSIWLRIVKESFWDKLNLDKVKSQAVANLMFSWIWGSGYAWRNKFKDYLRKYKVEWSIDNFNDIPVVLNRLTDKYGEKKIFDELVQQKKEYLESLNQPSNINGWLKRLNELQNYSYTLIDNKNKKILPFILITLGSISLIYFTFFNKKTKLV